MDKCRHCSDEQESFEHYYENSPVCNPCWEEEYTMCEACHSTIPVDKAMSFYDDIYCEDCHDDRFTYVECCETYIRSEDVCTTSNGDNLCNEHYSERVGTCDGCEDEFDNDDLDFDDDRDGYFCRDCHGTDVVHNYNYKPLPEFHKMEYENTLYMGIELEVNCPQGMGATLSDHAKEFTNWLIANKADNMFYLKRDASITDCHNRIVGWEIVSHPATLKWWHNSGMWKKVMSWLKDEGYNSFTGNCGLHVHINKTALTPQEKRKLQAMFWWNKEWIKQLSRRDSGYATFQPTNKSSMFALHSEHRFSAVNFTPRDTVEFRTFRGTLSHDRFVATLQFVDAVVHFVKTHSMMTCWTPCFKEFCEFLKRENRYGHLLRYLNDFDNTSSINEQ